MKPAQECIDHKRWDDHLRVAFWALVIIAFVLLFAGNWLGAIVLDIFAAIIFVVSVILDVRHQLWHMKKIEERRDNED